MKKLMSISDLHSYFKSQGKKVKFSSKDSDQAIVVHITEPYKFSSSEDNELFLKTNLRFCHTEENVNECYISQETMEDALPTVYNMPILGYIWEDDNGTPKFAGHEFYEDENGDTVYEEIPIGIVPESSPLEFKKNDNGKTYLEGSGLIWKTYSKAAEILEREEDLSVSIEILVDELSYDEEKDILVFEKIRFTGVTILEEDPATGKEIQPGMTGAAITIEDFSEKNSLFAKEEIKKFIQDSVKEAMNTYSQRKEENNQMNHFEELLQKYEKTVEEITFAYEGLSDEELDAAFAEAFENAPDNGNTPEPQEENVEFSVTYKGETKTFAKSLNEQISEITNLVNATYGYEDNTWYDCEVFDDHTVLFHGWNGKHFKQKYGNKEGSLVLKGDRVELFVRYLTEEELAALDDLKSKFDAKTAEFDHLNSKLAEATKELDLYKAEPEKISMLDSEDYSSIKDSAEFAELSKRENYFSLGKDELKNKLDGMLLEFAKKQSRETKIEPVAAKRFGFGDPETKSGRYGGVFKKN